MTPFMQRLTRLGPIIDEARHDLWYGDEPTCERIVRLHRHALNLWRKGKIRVAHRALDEIERLAKEELP